ncbi:MAG: cell division protein ZapA [Gammaproteobacteria bacterium]|nr:cell division protein ZapA [Gammaproteobacteria bacterium]
MRTTGEGLDVSILGKVFSVACGEDEHAELLAAAQYLDQKMRRIHASGKVIGLERSAVMAALNITHELLRLRKDIGVPEDFEGKLRDLRNRIDSALLEQHEFEL